MGVTSLENLNVFIYVCIFSPIIWTRQWQLRTRHHGCCKNAQNPFHFSSRLTGTFISRWKRSVGDQELSGLFSFPSKVTSTEMIRFLRGLTEDKWRPGSVARGTQVSGKGGQHSTEVAFALLTWQPQVWILALSRYFPLRFFFSKCLVHGQYREIEPI